MNRWIQEHGRLLALLFSTLLALASFALPAGLFARWTAVALILASVPLLTKELRPLVADGKIRTFGLLGLLGLLPYVLTLIGCLHALWPIPLGEMPVSQDHANHYFSTHILVNDLIPSGRFFGWTDRLSTGYPFGDIYSTSCYLVTGFFHLVSFGAISLSTSYALGLTLVWLLPAWAIVAWTKRIAGSGGAVLASLAFLYDMGSDREAGWVYAMFHGVWPQLLGVGIWLFALLALWSLAERATTRNLAASAFLVGLALVAHPMNSVTLIIAAILMFAIRLLFRDKGTNPGAQRGAIRLVPAVAIGGFIGLAWVARMVMTGDLLHTYPAYWRPISELMGHLLDGGLFEHEVALVAVFAVLGVLHIVRQGGRFGALTISLLAALLVVGSMDFVLNADLGLVGGKFGIMQYRRFSIPAKPLWYALAGAGISAVSATVFSLTTSDRGGMATLGGRILFSVVLAPFVWGLIQASPGFIKSPAGRPLTMERTADGENVRAIGKVLAEEKKRCENRRCLAVYWEKKGWGGLYPLVALADSGYRFLPTAKLPANNFRWINYTQSIDSMSRLGATVLVTRWKKDHPLLEELGTFGLHTVYRIKGNSDGRVEVRGPGQGKVQSWEDERRVIELAGRGPDTKLIVLMPPYRKWRAFQNGKPLRMVELRESGLVLGEILGADNGKITLEYQDSLTERILIVISSVLAILCLVGLFMRPRPLPSMKTQEQRAKVYRCLQWGLSGFFLLVVLGVAIGGNLATTYEWAAEEPAGREVLSVLHRSGGETVTFEPDFYCVRPYTRDPSPGCSEHELTPRVVAGQRRGGKIPSCLQVGIPPSGQTRVSYPIPEGTSRLRGWIHQFGGSGFRAQVAIEDNGKEVTKQIIESRSRQGVPFFLDTSVGKGKVTILLSGGNNSRACLELVALGR